MILKLIIFVAGIVVGHNWTKVRAYVAAKYVALKAWMEAK